MLVFNPFRVYNLAARAIDTVLSTVIPEARQRRARSRSSKKTIEQQTVAATA